MGRKAKRKGGMVREWRKPRNAEELFEVLQLFLDDEFGLVGSSSRNEHGGDLDVESGRFSAKIIVSDDDRDDDALWMKVSLATWRAFEKWEEAGRPGAREPSVN